VLASRLLSEAGFIPFLATDGPSALQLLDAHAFDLIVVDFVMPEMWGDEFVRRVRSHKDLTVRRTPVLGLSGSCSGQPGPEDAVGDVRLRSRVAPLIHGALVA
jgi:CheY-like chemotaxis protein